MQINLTPIGFIESDFREKFGIPRQGNLVPSSRARLKLQNAESIAGLEDFTHLWLIYLFHGLKSPRDSESQKPKVRPPRLGGTKKIGVFASRSPHRPNPLGLSAVKLEAITESEDGKPVLELSGVDLLDGTPVLDIKPYLPYADSISHASSGWAPKPELHVSVRFADQARRELEILRTQGFDRLERLVVEILSLDPRPAFQRSGPQAEYAMRIMDFDVHWIASGTTDASEAEVLFIRDLRGVGG